LIDQAAALKAKVRVSNTTLIRKYVPIKVTSMGSPVLLERMTKFLHYQKDHPSFEVPWSKNSSPFATEIEPFTSQEIKEYNDLMGRLTTICAAADKVNVALLFDAEQSWRYTIIIVFG
jgi:proline dehydrogenase